jgi:hypothetical protein
MVDAGLTHIVGETMTLSRAEKFLRRDQSSVASRKAVVCVHPDWVTDSIKKKQRLPEDKYIIVKDNRQSTLIQSFSKTVNASLAHSKAHVR